MLGPGVLRRAVALGRQALGRPSAPPLDQAPPGRPWATAAAPSWSLMARASGLLPRTCLLGPCQCPRGMGQDTAI